MQPRLTSGSPSLALSNIAITGRLAALSRTDAIALVEAHGGRYAARVTETTTLLVVGAAGWPLKANGRLTNALEEARRLRRLGSPLSIESEEAFLRRVDAPIDRDVSLLKQYTVAELCGILDVSPQRVQNWIKAGLLKPTEVRNQVAWFDFDEVTRCRALRQFAEAGISLRRVVRSLQQIRSWSPHAAAWLDHMDADGGRLVCRDGAGRLVEPEGQFVMDFDDALPAEPAAGAVQPDLFDVALLLEAEGKFGEAAQAYRKLLEHEEPDADVCFNLANVLHAAGERARAERAYRDAVELDPSFIEAWNNLAGLLAETGRGQAAVDAYRKSLAIDAENLDALYGMASALEDCRRFEEATWYWMTFLSFENEGECADYARSRLRKA